MKIINSKLSNGVFDLKYHGFDENTITLLIIRASINEIEENDNLRINISNVIIYLYSKNKSVEGERLIYNLK